MLTFYLLFAILYWGMFSGLRKLWEGKKNPDPNFIQKENPQVSILVPFRNEAQNLPAIFHGIISLQYRPLQVLWIDDHSEDEGLKILNALTDKFGFEEIEIEIFKNKGIGKKMAVQTGIERAFGDIILTTDADCFLPNDWVENKLKGFSDPKVMMVAGPVISQKSKGFFSVFQQIEWSSIILITKVGFELQAPLMCSAANMAYRKKAFVEVDGYNGNLDQLSGDDEFLLKKISKRFGIDSVCFMTDNLVMTKPHATWGSLFSQRVRWSSKWRSHTSLAHMAASILPVLIQLVFISSICLIWKGKIGIFLFLILWMSKILAERKVLGEVLETYGIKFATWNYVLTGIIHPFYVLVSAIGGIFGKFEWKGRKSSNMA